MVVVDHLNEWLDFGSLLDSLLAHATSDFRRVALNACDQSVGEWVLLGALVDWLNDDDLSISVNTSVLQLGYRVTIQSPLQESCVPSFRHIGLE